MSNRKVSSITYGALLTALLGVVLFFNRQAAGILDMYMFWFLPIPVIVYCLKFDVRQGMIMAAAMVILAFIVSTPTSLIYVVASLAAGLIYSNGLKKGKSAFQLIVSVIIISLIVMVLTTFVFSAAFGYNIADEINYMREYMSSIFSSVGLKPAEYATSYRFILSIVIIASVLSSVMEGILVHLLTFIVLRRLKMPLPPMKPLGEIICPGWLRFLVFVCSVAYVLSIVMNVHQYDEIVTLLMVFVYVICAFFGYLLILAVLAMKFPNPKTRAVVVMPICLVSLIIYPIIIVIGFVDIFSNVRQNIIREIRNNVQQNGSN